MKHMLTLLVPFSRILHVQTRVPPCRVTSADEKYSKQGLQGPCASKNVEIWFKNRGHAWVSG